MKSTDLSHRVQQFRAFSLPQQPPRMHKGTLYLIEDLVLEVERLEEENECLSAENEKLRGTGARA